MGARGRPSHTAVEAAALQLVRKTRMVPPRGTPKAERAVWNEIVSSFPAGHFATCDRQLMAMYCRAAVQASELAKTLAQDGALIDNASTGRKMVNPASYAFSNACGMLCQLAGKLRIAPSSRLRQDAADTRPTKITATGRPWDREAK